jgi:hypothetical protein
MNGLHDPYMFGNGLGKYLRGVLHPISQWIEFALLNRAVFGFSY